MNKPKQELDETQKVEAFMKAEGYTAGAVGWWKPLEKREGIPYKLIQFSYPQAVIVYRLVQKGK